MKKCSDGMIDNMTNKKKSDQIPQSNESEILL